MLVCTAAQMREIDRTAIEDYGVPGVVLMESAGRGVADVVSRLCDPDGLRVVVLCGSGNNGGDGYVVARHLIGRGARVTVFMVAERTRVAGDALVNLEILERMRADIRPLHDAADLDAANTTLVHAAVLVDALLGTGLNSDVGGQVRAVLERANRSGALRVAVDIPSGLNADSGATMGLSFAADHTVTFAFPKVGLVTAPGVERAGVLHVVDIGIPAGAEEGKEFAARVIDAAMLSRSLQHRPRWGDKETYGHLLAVAGAPGRGGSALMCGESALRCGTGLCTVATPAASVVALECSAREVVLAPLLDEGQQLDDSDAVFHRMRVLLGGASAVSLGPCLPAGPGVGQFLARVLREAEVPVLLDGEALDLLSDRLECLAEATVPVLTTPQPGELAQLSGRRVDEIQADRLGSAVAFARQHRVFVALKGWRTIVATPDGDAFINPTGNTGLATGGTGGILTGMVGGFMAQRHDPVDALCLGVYVHGRAGDVAAERSGQHGLLASDLLPLIGPIIKEWE